MKKRRKRPKAPPTEKIESPVRRGTILKLPAVRTLFSRLIGDKLSAEIEQDTGVAGLSTRSYLAWAAFRAGLELGQRGEASAGIVSGFRKHLEKEPKISIGELRPGFAVRLSRHGRTFFAKPGAGELPFVFREKEKALAMREKLQEGGLSSCVVMVWFAAPLVDERGMDAGDPRCDNYSGLRDHVHTRARGKDEGDEADSATSTHADVPASEGKPI